MTRLSTPGEKVDRQQAFCKFTCFNSVTTEKKSAVPSPGNRDTSLHSPAILEIYRVALGSSFNLAAS